MAQVEAGKPGKGAPSHWIVELPPGRLGGRLIFKFSDGMAGPIRHERLTGGAIEYNFPFSGRSPSREDDVRRFVDRFGAGFAVSELERNQFVRFRTEFVFDHFVGMAPDGNHRILDFGCGAGHSLDALLSYYPNARFTGSDIAAQNLEVLDAYVPGPDRARIDLVRMNDPENLEQLGGPFDLINLNAVFEHLLPAERRRLLPGLWRQLAVGGMLVVTETPWRWFPIETHTTTRPLVNYLPDRLALAVARRSRDYDSSLTWNGALRDGIRGATIAEVVNCVDAPPGTSERIQSGRPDARDQLEVWWWGESRHTRQKTIAYRGLGWLRRMTGIVISPWVNIVLLKTAVS
jgi:SAM-dependent methyltransferase